MFMLDPTPSMLLNGILFFTQTGEGVTAWKRFQHRKFLIVKYNYLVKVIDNVVALHKAIWLSAFACFFRESQLLCHSYNRGMHKPTQGTWTQCQWARRGSPSDFCLFPILFFAYWFGHYPWATTHIASPSSSKLHNETGRNRSNFCSVSPLPTGCYLQSEQLPSVLLVLVFAITELFV